MEANVKKITAVVNNLNDLIHEKKIKKEPVELLTLVREIKIDSRQGEGTRVVLSLPISE